MQPLTATEVPQLKLYANQPSLSVVHYFTTKNRNFAELKILFLVFEAGYIFFFTLICATLVNSTTILFRITYKHYTKLRNPLIQEC